MTTGKKRMVFIINPVSGTRKKDHIPDLFRNYFGEDFEVEIFFTAYPGHARELAENAVKKNVDAVMVAGGDGTINEVSGALLNTGIPVGIIPGGSGNGLARHLGIPMNTKKAMAIARLMNSITIDAGMVNGRPFFCTAGIGFDAHIGKEFLSGKSKGLYGYVNHVMREYFQYKPLTYNISVENSRYQTEAFAITFANAGQYGNNAMIAPDADITDGLLDLCTIGSFPKFKGIGMSLRLFNKSLGRSSYYSSLKITEARIETEGKNFFHLDGEVFPFENTIEAKVLPASLKIIAGPKD